MNFLAHAYLSNNHEEIMIGNFIADRVKGKAYQNYSPNIQKGILLHRFIDDFCDRDEINLQSSRLLSPYFGKYSMVVTDVINDYFLAINWENYHDSDYRLFVQQIYYTLEKNKKILPDTSRQMLPYMIQQDWIGTYNRLDGIAEILKMMSRRTKFDSGMEFAHEPLKKHLEELQHNFNLFFPKLEKATTLKRNELLKNE